MDTLPARGAAAAERTDAPLKDDFLATTALVWLRGRNGGVERRAGGGREGVRELVNGGGGMFLFLVFTARVRVIIFFPMTRGRVEGQWQWRMGWH